jgi:hypothetical protein
MHNISSCINEEPYNNIKDIAPNASKFFETTVQEQQKIGWEQVLKGRLSRKWGELYNYDIEQDKLKMTLKDAEQWGKKVIIVIWKFVTDMWRIRNDKEHNLDGNNKEIEKKKEGEQIKWIIKALKEFDEEHPYMNITDDTLQKQPLQNIKNMNEQLQTLYESVKAKHISRKGKEKQRKNIEIPKTTPKNSKKKKTRKVTKEYKIQEDSKSTKRQKYTQIKTNKNPLSLTVQAISHVSTHTGGPHPVWIETLVDSLKINHYLSIFNV